MTARSFTDALAAEPLDIAVIGRLWSRDGGMGNERSEEDYSDEGCRVLARHAFRDVNDLLAEVRELRESRERAIRWAVHLEGQNAAALALHARSTLSAGELTPGRCIFCENRPELELLARYRDYLNGGRSKVWMHDHFDPEPNCVACDRHGYDTAYADWPCATVAALAGGGQE